MGAMEKAFSATAAAFRIELRKQCTFLEGLQSGCGHRDRRNRMKGRCRLLLLQGRTVEVDGLVVKP